MPAKLKTKAKKLYSQIEGYATKLIERKCQLVVVKWGLSTQDAEDMAQEVHIDLLQHLARFDPEKTTLERFVIKLVKNCIFMLLRDRSAKRKCTFNRPLSLDQTFLDEVGEETDMGEAIADPSDPDGKNAERQLILKEAIEQMPPEMRTVFNHLKTMSAKATAKKLGVHHTVVYQEIKMMEFHFQRHGVAEEYFGTVTPHKSKKIVSVEAA